MRNIDIITIGFVAIVATSAIFKPKLDNVSVAKQETTIVPGVAAPKEDWADEYERKKNALNDFIKTLNPMECFRFTIPEISKHAWEVSRTMRGHAYMILDKDETGILIIQPRDEECWDTEIEECDKLWLRTIEYADNWLPTHIDVEVTECPKIYTKERIKELDRVYPEYKVRFK